MMQVREGWEGAVAIRRWRRASRLAPHAAANEVGVSERMLAYYESGERPVPRPVILRSGRWQRALTTGSAPMHASVGSTKNVVALHKRSGTR
jgi:predicted transcriptional regulator